MICPKALQDLKFNTKNPDAAIKAQHVQYGPLNVDEPADYWNDIITGIGTSKKQLKNLFGNNC